MNLGKMMHRILLLSCLIASAAPSHAQSSARVRPTIEPMLTPSSADAVTENCDRLLAQADGLRKALETDRTTPSLDTFPVR
jgi:hypothetical protein